MHKNVRGNEDCFMKHSVLNPYLPLYEYIPDGEPRIFGNRLYVYGSHDFAGGEKGFCPGDYMVWSAPLDDLGDWQCGGVIFPRSSCPDDLSAGGAMAAPDVVQGVDGRYYLYYNVTSSNPCHIAVSDTPEGPFLPYGDVCSPDGAPYDAVKMFDPGVLVDDDNRVYLFIGFCMPGPPPAWLSSSGIKTALPEYSLGFELAADMKTIINGPVHIIPGGNVTAGTGFEGHGFYEAPSPRKINGKYVLAYSSELSHEMAYAIADEPLGPYTYAGALVSCANLGLNGNTTPVMPYGNVHGGMVQLHGDCYIFYHRHTSGQEASRQGCAQKLPIRDDGWFAQAEITSCGLNDGPLPASGSLNACYCCHLTSPQIAPERLTTRTCRRATEPHIYEEPAGTDETQFLHYIANIGSGTVVGYRYFRFDRTTSISLRLRGSGNVTVSICLDRPDAGKIAEGSISLHNTWETLTLAPEAISGVHALYFCFGSAEAVQFESFSFS